MMFAVAFLVIWLSRGGIAVMPMPSMEACEVQAIYWTSTATTAGGITYAKCVDAKEIGK